MRASTKKSREVVAKLAKIAGGHQELIQALRELQEIKADPTMRDLLGYLVSRRKGGVRQVKHEEQFAEIG